MIKLFKWFIGGKIQTIIGIAFALLILGTPVYLYATYKNAISDAKRFKFERDELVSKRQKLIAYSRDLALKIDSLKYIFKQDSLMRQNQIGDLQKTLLKQRNIIKDKDELIDDMKNGIKCKNIFGKIVDC
jgi:DNA polymerase III delta prime subunit